VNTRHTLYPTQSSCNTAFPSAH